MSQRGKKASRLMKTCKVQHPGALLYWFTCFALKSAVINSTISIFCDTASLTVSLLCHANKQAHKCTPLSMWNESWGHSICSLASLCMTPARCSLIKAIERCHTMKGWWGHWSGPTNRAQQYGGEWPCWKSAQLPALFWCTSSCWSVCGFH